jgi:hypothetical protein
VGKGLPSDYQPFPDWQSSSRQRKVLSVKNTVRVSAFLALSLIAAAQVAIPRPSGGISGTVRYPGGSPIAEATVYAVTDCQDMGFNLVQEVKTSTDGSFYVSPFLEANCDRVRLKAKKVEDLWLETGRDVFYEGDNGTAPVINAARAGAPTNADITLGKQGAQVNFRVWDKATARFIWAELYIERTPVRGAKFGSMQIATGRDGSPDTLLLPAGQCKVTVQRYACKGADYFTASQPAQCLTVGAGQRVAEDISVDVRLIQPVKSYNNPHARPCEP